MNTATPTTTHPPHAAGHAAVAILAASLCALTPTSPRAENAAPETAATTQPAGSEANNSETRAALKEAEDKSRTDTDAMLKSLQDLGRHPAMDQYRSMAQQQDAFKQFTVLTLGPALMIELAGVPAIFLSKFYYGESPELFQQELSICEKPSGPEPEHTVGLQKLAFSYFVAGQYDQALSLFERSLAICEKTLGPEHADTATAVQKVAISYFMLGQYNQALPLFERSLTIREKVLGSEHTSTGESLNNLAVLYRTLGQDDKAVPLFKRSRAIQERTPKHIHSSTGTSLEHPNLKALPLSELNLMNKLSKVLPAERADAAAALNGLGWLNISFGKPEDAEALFYDAVTRTQGKQEGRETLWRAQRGLSLLYTKQQALDLAILWGKEAVNTIQSLRRDLRTLEEEIQSSFVKDKRPAYQDLADLLIAAGRIPEAQEVLQMYKEQELFDMLQRSSASDPRTTRIELTGLERKAFARYYELQEQQIALGNTREQLENKKKSGEITPAEQRQLDDILTKKLPPLREAMTVFLKSLQKDFEAFAKLKEFRKGAVPLALAETRLQKVLADARTLDPKAKVVALQYVVTDTRLSILLSTPGAPVLARQIEFDGKALRNRVLAMRMLLSDPQSSVDAVKEKWGEGFAKLISPFISPDDSDVLQKQLRELYAQLIAPIANDLKATGADTLILVPNDVLRYVPFAALHDGERYLVQDYTLTLFNEAVKKDYAAPSKSDWKLAAMGLTQKVEDLPALTSVKDEVNAITTQTGLKGKAYLDDAFTRPALTGALNQDYTVLHLATHFVFAPGRPDASRLFLGDRSALYLSDIAREKLNFSRFALVTFSACESGLGGGLDVDGREMESLGALVQLQGAQAVMATLWKVEDSSTAKLMKHFYSARHADQLGKAQALRSAQLKFIKGGGVLSRPYYWAPFVLMGDWR